MSWRRIALAAVALVAAAMPAYLSPAPLTPAVAEGSSASSPAPALPLISPSPGGGGGGGGSGGGGGGGGAGGSGPSFPPPPPPPPPPGGGGGGNAKNPPTSAPPGLTLPGEVGIDLPVAPQFLPSQAVVVFRGTDPVDIGAAFAAEHDSTVADNFRLARLNLQVFLLNVSGTRPFEVILQEMTADPRPLWVQRDLLFTATQSMQTAQGANPATQYPLERIRLGAVPGLTGGTTVKIAMVDSGVDLTHASLSGARITVIDVIRNKDNAPGEAHGTAIAGIMLGRNALAGIAPQAQLLAIRAFRQIGSGSSAAQSSSYYVAKGISRAVDAQVQVINLSLTGPQDRLVTQSVEQALLGRIAVVAAAGNAGPGAPPAYPAAQPGVIAVTATDGRDRLYKHANRGSYVTLAAPGVDILCAAPGNAYDYLSGTSMASAYVSGLTALMLDRQSGLGPSQIRKILEATATDLGPPRRDQQFGAGRIDAAAAFSQLAGN